MNFHLIIIRRLMYNVRNSSVNHLYGAYIKHGNIIFSAELFKKLIPIYASGVRVYLPWLMMFSVADMISVLNFSITPFERACDILLQLIVTSVIKTQKNKKIMKNISIIGSGKVLCQFIIIFNWHKKNFISLTACKLFKKDNVFYF